MDEAEIPVFSAGRAKENLLTYCLINLNGDFSEKNVRECILLAEKYGDDSGYGSVQEPDGALCRENIGLCTEKNTKKFPKQEKISCNPENYHV